MNRELTGKSISKQAWSLDGFFKRKEVLKNICPFTEEIVETGLSKYRRKEVAKDDILDALAAAITAKMGYTDLSMSLMSLRSIVKG